MTTPTVGLVGSRVIDNDLQSSNKKTVTEFAFPKNSRTPNQISIPKEGAWPNPNTTVTGDCYATSVEDTNLYASLHAPHIEKCSFFSGELLLWSVSHALCGHVHCCAAG